MIRGIDSLRKSIGRQTADYVRRLKRAHREAAEILMRESDKIVPQMTGRLRESAFINQSGSGFDLVTTAGYATEYAVEVHERPDYAHGEEFNRKHAAAIAAAPPGDPFYFKRRPEESFKYLEIPLRQNWDEMEYASRNALRDVI